MNRPNKQRQSATIRITDLKLRAIIGIFDWERTEKQDVIINVLMEYDAGKAIKTDKINHALDYKAITKKIITKVEVSNFFLLEKLADMILNIVMENKKVLKAQIRVDKPLALRFAKSVSVEISAQR